MAGALAEAIAAHRAGRLDTAEAAYRAILADRPDHPDVPRMLGFLLGQQGRNDEAEALLARAIALAPDLPPPHHAMGTFLVRAGRPDAAIARFEEALRIKPDLPETHLNLAAALRSRGRMTDAIDHLRRAIHYQPGLVTAWRTLASLLAEERRYEEALPLFERLARFGVTDADNAVAHAFTLKRLGRLEQAGDVLRAALARDPQHVLARHNLAHLQLLRGDWPEGWALLEARWAMQLDRADGSKLGTIEGRPDGLVDRTWSGEALGGATLLVWHEQGLGDTIHFARFLPLAAQRARVIAAVRVPLIRLLRLSFPELAEVRGLEHAPPHDAQLPFMSLPRVFETTPGTVPGTRGYLRAAPDEVDAWRTRLGSEGALRVGLVWGGSSHAGFVEANRMDATRSIPLALLAPLFEVPGVAFVSAQMDAPAFEIAASGLAIADHAGRLGDMADTAALLCAVDLVISVDTSVVHLAGALGRPVWLFNRVDTDWRWGAAGSRSPWYATMRIFRQVRRGDWSAPIAEMRAALVELAGRGDSGVAEGLSPSGTITAVS